jgi:hypothetical protein
MLQIVVSLMIIINDTSQGYGKLKLRLGHIYSTCIIQDDRNIFILQATSLDLD